MAITAASSITADRRELDHPGPRPPFARKLRPSRRMMRVMFELNRRYERYYVMQHIPGVQSQCSVT